MEMNNHDAWLYWQMLQSILERQSLHDLIYEGLTSPILYWTFLGYFLSGLPIAIWHLHKHSKMLKISTTTALSLSIFLAVASWCFLDNLGGKVFFLLGGFSGAFCTNLHFEIADLVFGHLEASKIKFKVE